MKFLPCWLVLAAILPGLPGGRAQGEPFDFETLRFRAKLLAAQPYHPRESQVPKFLLDLSYDEYRRIRFNPDHTWWRRERLPFQLQFFHPGFIFNHTVQLHELDGRKARDIAFDRDRFIYDRVDLPGDIPDTMGFAGFRILYDLNKPGDELGAFLGASYFRLLCGKAVYGLSARGLAINTAEPGGEEFPAFEEFWVQKPAPDARDLVVYALLDSPSVTGAYRLEIAPGGATVVRVRAAVYRRNEVKAMGLAPLSSMFWHGENSRTTHGDFRPEVHDTDGLLLQRGSGEWLWRPLVNPDQLRLTEGKEVFAPGEHQVLARVEACGVCFSDLKLLKQFHRHARKSAVTSGIPPRTLAEMPNYAPGDNPTVPGHEAVIRVAGIGADITRYKVGDRFLVQTDYRWLPTASSNAAFGYNFCK